MHAPRLTRHRALNGLLYWAPLLGLWALLALGVWATGVRALHIVRHPYPLDYGEGPLQAQIEELRAGRPLPQLYADPGQPPRLVVNYPPLVPALSALLSAPVGSALRAGRLLELLATLAAALALARLTQRSALVRRGAGPLLAAALFLGLSVVREWAALLRVDMLALACGLWGLALALEAPERRRAAVLAGALFTLSLFAKPSLIAAPGAALLWLLAVAPRRAAVTLGTMALLGGLAALLLQLGSDGWFFLHVVLANANRFDAELGRQFWRDHWWLHWPLVAASVLGAIALWDARPRTASRVERLRWLLPTLYVPLGAATALGVGKVGAYANYFLELDAGMVWLACAGLAAARARLDAPAPGGVAPARSGEMAAPPDGPPARPALFPLGWNGLRAGLPLGLLLILLAGQAARYYPLWDSQYTRGMPGNERAPRLVAGRHPIWSDMAREAELLAGLERMQGAVAKQVRAAGSAPVLTDIPGLVIGAGGQSRLQVFEMRQLLDQGLWRQDELLHELANGAVPLIVLEWLGNWLSPEAITLIRHRYAPDGMLGRMRLYRPVATGPFTAQRQPFAGGPTLTGYHLLPPVDGDYRPGEQVAVTLVWEQGELAREEDWLVAVALQDEHGAVKARSQPAPLLYGALLGASWPASGTLQQVARFDLPQLPPGPYRLALELNRANPAMAPPAQVPPTTLRELRVGAPLGRVFAETNYYVPAPMLRAWSDFGGLELVGLPVTSPIPHQGRWLQCFERACFELPDGARQPTRLPVGERLALDHPRLDAALPPLFRAYWERYGELQQLGPPISAQITHVWREAQYFRFARLEHDPNDPTATVTLGRVGADYMGLNDADRFVLP